MFVPSRPSEHGSTACVLVRVFSIRLGAAGRALTFNRVPRKRVLISEHTTEWLWLKTEPDSSDRHLIGAAVPTGLNPFTAWFLIKALMLPALTASVGT